MARPKDGPLIQENQIITTAIQLVEREGQGTLSMRRIAKHLGVNPMALYHYVSNKNDLVGKMVETVSAELKPPTSAGLSWQARITAVAAAYRQLAQKYPNTFPLLLNYPNFVRSDFRIAEVCLDALAEVGLPSEKALAALAALQAYVEGFVLDELIHGNDELDVIEFDLPDETSFPQLSKLVQDSVRTARDDIFQLGLELMIGGLEKLAKEE